MHSALRLPTLCALLWCGALPACGDSAASAEEQLELSPLQAEQERIVLDPVPFGESGQGLFTLRNESDQDQIVQRIGPASCSCTSLRLLFPERAGAAPLELTGRDQDIEIRAGETVQVEVTFDTARLRRPVSRRTDGFAVMVRGQPGSMLEYAVDVWTPFWVEPWAVELGRVGVREQASGFATVKAHDEDGEFELIVPETVEGWRIETRAVETGSADFAIEFFAPEELPLGPFDVRVPVRANLPDSPTLTVSVRGIAVPDLDWSPQRLSLLPDANGQASATVNLVSRATERPLGLRAVIFEGLPEDYADALQATSRTVKPEQAFAIDITMQRPPATRLEGRLVLVTDDPDQPRIDLPLVVRPRP